MATRLRRDENALRQTFAAAQPTRHVVVDDAIPDAIAQEISRRFPQQAQLMRRATLRERKHVGVRVEDYEPLVREALLALLEAPVLAAVGAITGIAGLRADPTLYASGVSVMARGDFLNPHIDNSHDGDNKLFRVLNLLLYVSPAWSAECGGSLELWDPAVRVATPIEARCGRLVIMQTDRTSWHSVNAVSSERPRQCLSSYFFAPEPADGGRYRHVTTFTGRPEQPLRRTFLNAWDGCVLNAVGRTLPALTRRTRHRRSSDGENSADT